GLGQWVRTAYDGGEGYTRRVQCNSGWRNCARFDAEFYRQSPPVEERDELARLHVLELTPAIHHIDIRVTQLIIPENQNANAIGLACVERELVGAPLERVHFIRRVKSHVFPARAGGCGEFGKEWCDAGTSVPFTYVHDRRL